MLIEAEMLLYEVPSAIDDLGSSLSLDDCAVNELVGEYLDVHRLDPYPLGASLDPPLFVDHGIVQHALHLATV